MTMPLIIKHIDTVGREFERLEKTLNDVFRKQFGSLEADLIKSIRKHVKV